MIGGVYTYEMQMPMARSRSKAMSARQRKLLLLAMSIRHSVLGRHNYAPFAGPICSETLEQLRKRERRNHRASLRIAGIMQAARMLRGAP